MVGLKIQLSLLCVFAGWSTIAFADSPAPNVTAAREAYGDCLGQEAEKLAKTDMTAEDAARSMLSNCLKLRAPIFEALKEPPSNMSEAEAWRAMDAFDAKTHDEAVQYIDKLRSN